MLSGVYDVSYLSNVPKFTLCTGFNTTIFIKLDVVGTIRF